MGRVTKTGYVNGSDLMFVCGETLVDGRISAPRDIGHATEGTITVSDTYLEVCSKPTNGTSRGIYTTKQLIRQEISITATGFHFADESGCGYKYFLNKAISGQPFYLEVRERKETRSQSYNAYIPMFVGAVVITDLPLQINTGTATSYQINLINSGEPSILDASNLHYNTSAQ